MKTKHTPAPWKFDKEFNQIQSQNGETLVLSFGKTATQKDKLTMASAPELLEALKDLVLWANIKDESPSQHLRDKALQAIIKAEGN